MRPVSSLLAPSLAALFATATGCNQPTYLMAPRVLETMPGMGGGYAPDSDHYTLPIRKPTGAEEQALKSEQKALKLPHSVPWLGVRDMAVELPVTLANLDDGPARVFFTLGGGDEYGAYDPTQFYDPTNPEATPPPPLAGGTPIDLKPHETRQLLFREDDIAESALDLEAIVRYPSTPPSSTPYKVLTVRSDVSRTGLENIPPGDVTPQMIAFTLQLNANAHVTATYALRVRDFQGKLGTPGAGAKLYR